jgi:hypothetical protein
MVFFLDNLIGAVLVYFSLPYNFGQIMKVEKKNPFMPKI